ncbi:hypothetical protein CIL03_12035 [Virgibacillus indicus]|uniref:O-antigen ligase-related domain-containing protein n=1 Tax=Virgibacillus indicus TaxID=2024554 RepID=A0A265N8N8_9BACI|nr:O-antigen ligase family protein [Virgibacillus indicus]OZU88372.1 hypothetical protein CIL03_12035 [Virgibacillus indicus]
MVNNNSIKIESMFLVQIFILLILNTMIRTQYEVLKNIGELSIYLSFVFMLLMLIKSFIVRETYNSSLKMIYWSIALMMIINSLSFITTNKVDSLYYCQLMLLYLFILGLIRVKWSTRHIKLLGYISGLTLILLFAHWILSDFSVHRFKSIFRNPNYLAVLLFCLFYFKVLIVKYSNRIEKIYFISLIGMNFVLIYATNTRSVLIAFGVILISWLFSKYYRKLFHYIFYVTIAFNILFLFIYIKIQNTAIGLFLDNLSIQLLGKSLYSGRSELWDRIINKIIENPLFGYGLGTNARDITDTTLTSHNQYLQVLIETGIIGLILFIFLLYAIWLLLIKNLDNYVSRISACFFIGILVYENFELTLFQNNYSIAMLQWVIILIGINFNEKNNSQMGG